jgi:hypothetical protein
MAIKNVPTNNGEKGNILYLRARVQTGETKARIDDLNQDEDKRLDSFKVNIEDLPTYPKLPNKFVVDECQVIWDVDNSKVLAINPYVGVFTAVGTALGPRPDGEDSDPKAQMVEKDGFNGGKPYTVKNFHEIFKITDKESLFYGSTPRLFLQDKFVATSDGMAGYSGTEKSKWTVRLAKFGETQGLFDEDITMPKDGNVLPILEERILNNKREVQLVFEGGFINTLLPVMKKPAVVVPQRSNSEIMSEMGIEVDDEPDFMKDSVDEVDAPVVEKKAKKAAKKVEDPDDL